MQLFYTPDILDNIYLLSEEESKHCVKVLRLREKDSLFLTNGLGTLYKAEILEAKPKACSLKVIETLVDYEKRNYRLHIAIAPTKNIDRFEWFLEKATEIGIDEITPLICEHSERKIIKPERLERVVIAAMKQSLKAYKPIINPLTTIEEFFTKDHSNSKRYIAHCHEGNKEILKHVYSHKEKACILIGPEGDFSPQEIGLANVNGFQAVSLGNARLRTETAGVVACHTISLINQ